MTTVGEWGPEYEVRFQIKFKEEPVDAPINKNIFRFTIFNSVNDNYEAGSNIPAMWVQGKQHPLSLLVGNTLDNELKNWNLLFGRIRMKMVNGKDKWYNVTMKQYKYPSQVNMFIIDIEKYFHVGQIFSEYIFPSI